MTAGSPPLAQRISPTQNAVYCSTSGHQALRDVERITCSIQASIAMWTVNSVITYELSNLLMPLKFKLLLL